MTTPDSFTLEELLISRMAKEFGGNNMGVGATILADLSARLAKTLYVPDLFLTTASRAAADCDVHAKSLSDEWTMAGTARIGLDWEQMFQLIAQGRLQIWVGAVQIDKFGNSNISVVGDWEKPRVQLIGARGVPDDLWGCNRLNYHIRRHTRHAFVERVDFVCGAGFDGKASSRSFKRAPPGLVISDLGVFDFDDKTGLMRIRSLHPGVELERVRKMTGFAWPEPTGPIAVTEPPTAEELHVIRNVIDPLGLRRLESDDASDELTVELWKRDLPVPLFGQGRS
jgi:acyl CoA:acetate/3-ketoacid CoA transferase beta subunit